VDTRRLAAVPDIQDLADGFQGEPGGLGVPYEREAFEDGRVVVAVPGRVRAGAGSMCWSSQNRIVLAGTAARPAASPILILRSLDIPSRWKV
jgi:hypothetical protein